MMKTGRILVVDDEAGHRLMLRAILEDVGHAVFEAQGGEQAVLFLRENPADAVILDVRMPGMDGIQTLGEIRKINSSIAVIMLTAYGSVGPAVEAMKLGAIDYLAKPVDNEELKAVVDKALGYSDLLKENEYLKHKLSGAQKGTAIIGNSQAMRRVKEFIEQVGPSEATVLILGESGTGKELAAASLHEASSRSKAAMVKVNCAAIPSELLESELFGYEKGAFTGAHNSRPGKFQAADKGTIFLDEIGELSLPLQAKILRVLQERVVEPLGSVRSVPVDVRVLAATNRDPEEEVRAGRFRQDLYYRLNVVELKMPPLRERLDDLPILVGHLMHKLAAKNKRKVTGVSPLFFEALNRYTWPGNVRELENVLERAIVLSRGEVPGPELLPAHIREIRDRVTHTSVPSSVGMEGVHAGDTVSAGVNPLEEAERQAIKDALDTHGGHREKTADALNISRRTLQYKLKKYGLSRR